MILAGSISDDKRSKIAIAAWIKFECHNMAESDNELTWSSPQQVRKVRRPFMRKENKNEQN